MLWTRRNAYGEAGYGRNSELGNGIGCLRRDHSNFVASLFGEPDIAIWADRYASRVTK